MALRQIEFLLNGVTDTNGDPVSAGRVYVYIAGTTTEAVTYEDKDGLAPTTNPVILDANGIAQSYGDGVYKFVVKDSEDATLATYDNVFVGVADSQINYSGTSAGSANAYILTNDIPSTAYTVLDTYRFIANFGNTGVATVNIDGLGVKSIKRFDGTNLISGDIAINSFNEIVYNGTNFLLATNGTALSGSIAGLQTTLTSAIQNSSYIFGGTSGGSANAQTLTLTPALTVYASGQMFVFKAGYTNTGPVTLNINGLGAKILVDNEAVSSVGTGGILANVDYVVVVDLPNIRVLNPSVYARSSQIAEGAYIPSVTNTTNVAATTAYAIDYIRIGSRVFVSGAVDINPVTANIETIIYMSLPIVSAFTSDKQLSGTGSIAAATMAEHAQGLVTIFAEIVTDTALFKLYPNSPDNRNYRFHFSYSI